MSIQPLPPTGIDRISDDQTTRAAKVAAYVKSAGFSGDALVTALAIAYAESGWNYTAKGGPNSNGSYDWGLFQINDVHKPSDGIKTNPVLNARFAFTLYNRKGAFTDWVTYNRGTYTQHLDKARAAVVELNKRGADWENTVVKEAESSGGGSDGMAPGQLSTLGPNSPLDAVTSLGTALLGFLNMSLGMLLGIVLIVLGVVLLARKPLGGAIKSLPAGKVAKLGKVLS